MKRLRFYDDDGVTFRNGKFKFFSRQCFVHGWGTEGTLLDTDRLALHIGF